MWKILHAILDTVGATDELAFHRSASQFRNWVLGESFPTIK